MPKPHGRKTKKKVGKILLEPQRRTALELLSQIPDEQLTGHFFSYFYHGDELIKFRSIAAMGVLVSRMAQKNMEKARIVMRRIMWNLNDESGGIGWGSPEAFGEILYQSQNLALEFKSILFSYLKPGGNHIEHTMLQRGVLWGVGTYLESNPLDLDDETKEILFKYLHSSDPVKRGYAIRALINSKCYDGRFNGSFDGSLVPEKMMMDKHKINIFDDWNFITTQISEMLISG